ncbi:MAG TPA: sugar ABC transporter substrate-binding protein [Anaerolineae bacterium]
MRKYRPFLIGCALIVLAACQSATPPPPEPVTLHFTYWGSPVEKEAVEQMVRAFEAIHPDIKIEAQHLADSEYLSRVSAMIAAGSPPDVGYLLETHAPLWASEGKVLDMTGIIKSDPDLASRLPEAYYYYAPGKTIGTNTAAEIILLFYNKDVFDRAGVPYPPAKAEDAWTWDEFLARAQQLTTDRNGKHPGQPGFDPEDIDVYGVSSRFDYWYSYFPFIYSNGGQIVNAEGTRLLLDSPEAVEAIQRLADLMWVHHVMPTPQQAQRLPPGEVLMQTGKLAMDIRGQWKLLDYSSIPDLRLGVAVLPKMKEPKTLILGSPTVIFSGTHNLDAAIQFYKFHNDPKAVDLFARGLWMPLQKSYYTDPASVAAWIDNPAHPPESRDAIVNYTLCCVVRTPHYYVKNFGQIAEEVIQPAIDRVWANDINAAEALRQAVQDAAPLMAGRWDQ